MATNVGEQQFEESTEILTNRISVIWCYAIKAILVDLLTFDDLDFGRKGTKHILCTPKNLLDHRLKFEVTQSIGVGRVRRRHTHTDMHTHTHTQRRTHTEP